jgi:hypothetical protein
MIGSALGIQMVWTRPEKGSWLCVVLALLSAEQASIHLTVGSLVKKFTNFLWLM